MNGHKNKSMELDVRSDINDPTVNGDGYIEIHKPGADNLSAVNHGYSTDENDVDTKNKIMDKGAVKMHDVQINAEPYENEAVSKPYNPAYQVTHL